MLNRSKQEQARRVLSQCEGLREVVVLNNSETRIIVDVELEVVGSIVALYKPSKLLARSDGGAKPSVAVA